MIFLLIAAYYLLLSIMGFVTIQYAFGVNATDENAFKEKSKTWVDSYDQIKEATDCEDKGPAKSLYNSARGRLIICCICLFGISVFVCTLLFRSCYAKNRNTVKLEECQHIIVEKDCGCKFVYDPMEAP